MPLEKGATSGRAADCDQTRDRGSGAFSLGLGMANALISPSAEGDSDSDSDDDDFAPSRARATRANSNSPLSSSYQRQPQQQQQQVSMSSSPLSPNFGGGAGRPGGQGTGQGKGRESWSAAAAAVGARPHDLASQNPPSLKMLNLKSGSLGPNSATGGSGSAQVQVNPTVLRRPSASEVLAQVQAQQARAAAAQQGGKGSASNADAQNTAFQPSNSVPAVPPLPSPFRQAVEAGASAGLTQAAAASHSLGGRGGGWQLHDLPSPSSRSFPADAPGRASGRGDFEASQHPQQQQKPKRPVSPRRSALVDNLGLRSPNPFTAAAAAAADTSQQQQQQGQSRELLPTFDNGSVLNNGGKGSGSGSIGAPMQNPFIAPSERAGGDGSSAYPNGNAPPYSITTGQSQQQQQQSGGGQRTTPPGPLRNPLPASAMPAPTSVGRAGFSDSGNPYNSGSGALLPASSGGHGAPPSLPQPTHLGRQPSQKRRSIFRRSLAAVTAFGAGVGGSGYQNQQQEQQMQQGRYPPLSQQPQQPGMGAGVGVGLRAAAPPPDRRRSAFRKSMAWLIGQSAPPRLADGIGDSPSLADEKREAMQRKQEYYLGVAGDGEEWDVNGSGAKFWRRFSAMQRHTQDKSDPLTQSSEAFQRKMARGRKRMKIGISLAGLAIIAAIISVVIWHNRNEMPSTSSNPKVYQQIDGNTNTGVSAGATNAAGSGSGSEAQVADTSNAEGSTPVATTSTRRKHHGGNGHRRAHALGVRGLAGEDADEDEGDMPNTLLYVHNPATASVIGRVAHDGRMVRRVSKSHGGLGRPALAGQPTSAPRLLR
ncbi:hypothetical protein K437DRAFT_107707 [Tilletiaria anomala UBC 951]|uniref:Uncharacterized protein n=1 Tax=Tilletiaria anomala (strain ATCC 24038 / CBS 436.72 / UBC 951) TaxID=1037660 RepID=A0A066W6S2_TILAU|nr:uncharacterized protein K437DRAFT_107707 [Tilletiaria anomala UBC 951]KDN46470.1 hypothetical protein K437DRAFT_107707 [Tilletiaria anomala UBC 951]